MTLTKYYKGDDIKLPIYGFEDDGVTDLDIENDVLDIIIRVWTNPLSVLKFSKTDKVSSGYIRLVKESSIKYWLIIDGSVTAAMNSGNINSHAMVILSDTQMSDSRLNESGTGIQGVLYESANKLEV